MAVAVLNSVVAHSGQPVAPHDVWTAWNLEPVLVIGLVAAGVVYERGRHRGSRWTASRWRNRAFVVAMAAVALALVSPIDAMATSLASAHMVQHVLLLLVAAPLLAYSAPSAALLRGSPMAVRRATGRWRQRLRLTPRRLRAARQPIVVWLLHVLTVWIWHASVPYDAALQHQAVHVLEHTTFLVTGVMFWHVVLDASGLARVSHGLGVLLVFGMAVQSALLSALMTFSPVAWYRGYATTTAPWGLDPLGDQQLAGAIMWVPAGVVYVAVALALLVTWVQRTERDASAVMSSTALIASAMSPVMRSQAERAPCEQTPPVQGHTPLLPQAGDPDSYGQSSD